MKKTLGFCSFSSGSSGNSYMVCSEETAIIIDAGISAKKIIDGIKKCNIRNEDIKGIMVTHEHIDHTKSIKTIIKKLENAQVFANHGTWSSMTADGYEHRKEIFITGEKFKVGDIEIDSFNTSHDAVEPCGFTFSKGNSKISIVTDTGCINREIENAIIDSDLLIIEANHDTEILKMGNYPWSLKQRILGDLGHLSNESAGKAILDFIMKTGKVNPKILLAHLSKQNNLPEIAFQTVKAMLEDKEYYLDKDFRMELLLKDEFSDFFWI